MGSSHSSTTYATYFAADIITIFNVIQPHIIVSAKVFDLRSIMLRDPREVLEREILLYWLSLKLERESTAEFKHAIDDDSLELFNL